MFLDPRQVVLLQRPNGATYHLRPMTSGQWLEFFAGARSPDEAGTVSFSSQDLLGLAKACLCGWSNVEGAPPEWPGPEVAIDGLPVPEVLAIGKRALEMARLGAVERKNSDTPPLSQAGG